MRKIHDPEAWFVGKTIERVNSTSSINIHRIYFTDQTAVMVEALSVVGGIYGPVWYEIKYIPPPQKKWLVIFGNDHYGPFDSELEAETYGKDSKCGPYAVVQVKTP